MKPHNDEPNRFPSLPSDLLPEYLESDEDEDIDIDDILYLYFQLSEPVQIPTKNKYRRDVVYMLVNILG